LFICCWNYPAGKLPAHCIHIAARISAERKDPGFEVGAAFFAVCYELEQGADPADRSKWHGIRFEEFHGCDHALIGQQVAQAREPVFERFNADPGFQQVLRKYAPELAARYDQLLTASMTPLPSLLAKSPARSL
jgi:hypothetical protein